ncbi:cytochrome c oxidase assembly protein [Candidatus Thiothrix sp. Deng01]|uniref:Cytochrome c oxidase assembly protein CtaG n=1 Tax=Candidatus Thiothrix phosphatis TaxID=3112415 RepID=A0ABU6D425_9GAMM|nr:cytochrome c oxidase assembly protein [Candidatus Thiothrix sp. Deng01]MEB4593567.1 cytochrome c oxidase assembly protein [Candidatus Thiothrix sp. Deng01]
MKQDGDRGELDMQPQGKVSRRSLLKLSAIPVLMFGFGFLLVPFYSVFCRVTGLNGKTGNISAAAANLLQEDTSRLVKIQFVASVNQNGPWDFHPVQTSMLVHPGKPYSTRYYARNRLEQAMVSQSVPSIAPIQATQYFKKAECFCFTQQAFRAGEAREMPVTFVVNPELHRDVDTIILSYTLFSVSRGA